MKIAVITPTRLCGGLDVNAASLAAQRWPRRDLLWVVVDEHYEARCDEVAEHAAQLDFKMVHEPGPPRREGDWNNLASAYNRGLDLAEDFDADVIVSLQDYFWIPRDGLELYADMADRYPDDIYSGLASLSADPGVETVVNRDGGWTVFAKPWRWEQPREIAWHDVRAREGARLPFLDTPTCWEMNWSAWPRRYRSLRFNPVYQRGVGYDNQDFAERVVHEHGGRVWIDPRNHAVGLPHKRYYPEIETSELAVNNQGFHDARMAALGWR